MKISKNTVLGLGILSALVVLFVAVPVKNALAATVSGADLKGATYTFLDGGNISVTIAGVPDPVIFVDKQPNSNPKNYIPNSTFCDPGTGSYGINIGNNVDMKTNPISATIHVGNLTGTVCKVIADQTISIANPSQAGATDYQWDGTVIKSLNGAQDSVTFEQAPNGNDVAFKVNGSGNCGYSKFILLNSANGNTGKYYELSQIVLQRGGVPSQSQNLPDELKAYLSVDSCHVDKGPVNVSIAGQQGKAASGGSGSTVDAGDSCDLDANGLSLAWLMCPLLAAANDLVNGSDQSGKGGLLGLYQDQLSFNVNRDLSVVGGGANQVQTTWSLIKNIATAVLVIIMLLAIFSQSISAGPFDAYTIRKILPRLIAAAIFIQLSWYIAAWIIDLVDDLGGSLFYLLYAPFGGSNNLQFGHLLFHGGVTGTDAAIVSWLVLLPAMLVLGLAALPAVLLAVLAVITALFTALIVLVFRKIIIITCLIFAPLAILAWILPGTQRYWKMWYDNFLKVLFMYPLIVALIAAGHIFAFIVGTQNNNTFLNFILITIGVFGPLFILPKAFKWGGQFMNAAGGAITTATNKVGGKESGLGKGVRGYAERVQGKHAKAYDPNAGFRSRTLSRVRSGYIIPTARNRRLAIAAGDKWSSERDDEGLALVKRKGEKAMTDGMEIKVRDENGNLLSKNRLQEAGMSEDGKKQWYTNDGEITTDETQAARHLYDANDATDEVATKQLKGVAAMKQMWVDLAETGNENEKKMAVRQLTATASWPEIQGSFTSQGGVRVMDTDAFAKSIATSPEDYPKVLRSRVDVAPHIMDSADKAFVEENKTRAAAGQAALTGQAAADFKSAHRIHYAIKEQMSNEDFQTQSDGFWQEAARMASQKSAENVTAENPEGFTEQALKIQVALKDRFTSIQSIGGTSPQHLLGHLVGGGVQESVDKALNGGKVAANAPGSTHIKDFVDTSPEGRAAAAARAAAAPTTPPMTPPTTPPAAGDTPTEGDSGPLHPPSR